MEYEDSDFIKEFPGLTVQDIFNKIWQWFIVDKNPQSVTATGDCQYRSSEGKNVLLE